MKPCWPAVIKYHDDHELTYLDSEESWNINDELLTASYSDEDYLLDSAGKIFMLIYNHQSTTINLYDTNRILPIEDFSKLIQKHLCTTNECCISKVQVSTYIDGMNLVKSTCE